MGGVKLRVDVLETRAGPDAVPEREILVPAWTDDWGYCEDPYDEVSNQNPPFRVLGDSVGCIELLGPSAPVAN